MATDKIIFVKAFSDIESQMLWISDIVVPFKATPDYMSHPIPTNKPCLLNEERHLHERCMTKCRSQENLPDFGIPDFCFHMKR